MEDTSHPLVTCPINIIGSPSLDLYIPPRYEAIHLKTAVHMAVPLQPQSIIILLCQPLFFIVTCSPRGLGYIQHSLHEVAAVLFVHNLMHSLGDTLVQHLEL